MRSSIYINEVAPGRVAMDFSRSASGLASPKTMEGFVFSKTLDCLGMDHRVEETNEVFPSLFPRLYVEGSVESAQRNIRRLRRHIGVIARYGASRSGNLYSQFTREYIGKTLGTLVQTTLVELPPEASLADVCGLIAEPLADYVNYDGVRVKIGQPARWMQQGAG